jgi:hypothetical protein
MVSGTLMKAYIRYLDQFARPAAGSWLFAERRLLVDWAIEADIPQQQTRNRRPAVRKAWAKGA